MAKDLSAGLLPSLIQWLLTIGRAFLAKKDPAKSWANRGVLQGNLNTQLKPVSTSKTMSTNWRNVQYFSRDEFGYADGIEPCPDLVRMLDDARAIARVPFVINSGIRTPDRNAEVGGSPESAHLTGHAVDIRAADGSQRMAIVSAAIAVGFHRIGVARSFVHLDTDPSKPQGVLWTY